MTYHQGDVLVSQKYLSFEWTADFENGIIYNKNRQPITGSLQEDGYLQIGSTDQDGDKQHVYYHRALLIMYSGGKIPPSNLQVNHKNGIKTDNRWNNLEWSTPKENCNNPNTKIIGEKHHRSKLTDEQRMQICILKRKKMSNRKLAKQFGCSPSNISKVVRGMEKRMQQNEVIV